MKTSIIVCIQCLPETSYNLKPISMNNGNLVLPYSLHFTYIQAPNGKQHKGIRKHPVSAPISYPSFLNQSHGTCTGSMQTSIVKNCKKFNAQPPSASFQGFTRIINNPIPTKNLIFYHCCATIKHSSITPNLAF